MILSVAKLLNTLCFIHDPWAGVPLLAGFPSLLLFSVLGKLLLPQRWSGKKTSLEAAEKQMNAKNSSLEPDDFVGLRRPHALPLFFFFRILN